MNKYHIGKKGPGLCKASKGKCPLGGESGSENHYSTMAEASIAYEKMNAQEKIAQPLKKSNSKNSIKTMDINTYNFPRVTGTAFPGGTVKEYQDYMKKLNSKYSKPYMTEDFKKEIMKDLGISEAFGGDVQSYINWNSLDKEITLGAHDWSGTWEYGDSYDHKPTPENFENYDKAIKSPYYVDSETSISGYYAEEMNHEFRYKLNANDHADIIEKLNDFEEINNMRDQYERMNDPKLPDWASMPLTQTEDGNSSGKGVDFKKKFAEELKKDPNFKVENVRIPASNPFTAGKNKKIKDVAEADGATIDKAVKARDSAERRVKKLEKMIAEINDNDLVNKRKVTTPLPPGVRKQPWTGYVSPYRPVKVHSIKEFEKLNKNDKLRAMDWLKSEVEVSKNTVKNSEKKINDLNKISDAQIKKAKQEYSRIKTENEEKIKDNTIERLSYHFPSSDRNVRISEATKWVDAHPEII